MKAYSNLPKKSIEETPPIPQEFPEKNLPPEESPQVPPERPTPETPDFPGSPDPEIPLGPESEI